MWFFDRVSSLWTLTKQTWQSISKRFNTSNQLFAFLRVCIFKMFASFFLFVAKVDCFPWRKKVCVIVLFCCPGELFWGLRGSIRILVGGPWGPIGNSLGSLPLGFFFGGPSFLGFWEHPKVKFSKSRPCFKSIWVFYILVLGFTASCSIVPWIKFNSIEWDFYFYLGFYFCKLFDFFPITFEV